MVVYLTGILRSLRPPWRNVGLHSLGTAQDFIMPCKPNPQCVMAVVEGSGIVIVSGVSNCLMALLIDMQECALISDKLVSRNIQLARKLRDEDNLVHNKLSLMMNLFRFTTFTNFHQLLMELIN